MSSMGTSSRSLRVFETICTEMLTRLSSDTSDQGRIFAAEARQLLETLNRLAQEGPSPEARSAVIAHVLDLHRTVMDHTTVAHAKPPA